MTRSEWIKQHPEIREEDVTFTLCARRQACSRCQDTMLRYFYFRASDGTELEGAMPKGSPRYNTVGVCFWCITPEEERDMDAICQRNREVSEQLRRQHVQEDQTDTEGPQGDEPHTGTTCRG